MTSDGVALVVLLLAIGACDGAAPPGARETAITAAPAARDSAPATDSVEVAVGQIRAQWAGVERELPTYRCRTLALEGFSAGGGELVACFAAGELRKLTATSYGESGRAEHQFLMQGRLPQFVFRRDEEYTALMSGVVRLREDERFYFVGGRLVRWLGPDGAPEPVDAEDAQVEAANLMTLARQLAACALDPARDTCDA